MSKHLVAGSQRLGTAQGGPPGPNKSGATWLDYYR